MLSILPRFCSLVALAALVTFTSTVDAQVYRGRRAGKTISPTGRLADCNLSGAVFMETNKAFNAIDGGRCILNGARFELSEPSGDMGPYVPLEGVDLRHSSWVAVDFLTPPVLRYANAAQANFSSIHTDGEPVEMVDATGLIATKAKFHGAQTALWFVQGASFNEAEFTSTLLNGWTTDPLSYEGMFESAPESMRAMTASGAKFENCLLEECNLAGASFDGSALILTKFSEECVLNGCNFDNVIIEETDFLEANLSGASLKSARLDEASFEGCNLTGAVFSNAVIRESNFSGAEMRGVSFAHAIVEGSDFTGTDLSTSNLTNAVMKDLIGTPPALPQDFVIKSHELETVNADNDTLRTPVYDIVISEARYNDGYRQKKAQN